MSRVDLSIDEARRVALAAQGFDRPRPTGRIDLRHVRRIIRQVGLLQLDYVNVLVPAHYQVLFSRLGPYERTRLDDLVYKRREFAEHWAHEASVVPMETWPLLRHRRETHRVRPWGFEQFLEQHAEYVARVLAEVRARGPLTANDLPEPVGIPLRITDRWGWGLAVKRQVLEAHFGFGRLAVAGRRPNHVRLYDLTERVVPPEHRRRKVERDDAQRELLRLAARAHGVGTAGDLADYYRMPIRDARRHLTELAAAGELHETSVEGWRDPAYIHPNAGAPGQIDVASLLSPFDPVVWHRARVARLFGFDYRIEIFVPRPKRKWGYYVLPFLLGDRLVARVDLKAGRRQRRLLVLAAYREPRTTPAVVAHALAGELRAMAAWLGLDEVHVAHRGGLAAPLATALRRRARR